MNLPVLNNKEIPCVSCISTKQMKNSEFCTNSIMFCDGQYIPGCLIKIAQVNQEIRNFLMCGTYNLGIYSICDTCKLECKNNTHYNKNENSFTELMNLFGVIFGIDTARKEGMTKSFARLNTAEFKEIYDALIRSSTVIKDIMNGTAEASSGIAKRILENEANNIKSAFNKLIVDNKISKEEAAMLKAEVSSSENITKLKSLIETLKQTI